MLRASDYPLPLEYDRAYSDSEIVVFETDLEQNDLIINKLYLKMLSDEHISKMLSDRVYARLVDYTHRKKIDLEPIGHMKPWAVGLVLMLHSFADIGLDEAGIDMFYLLKAIDDNKERLILESIDEQLDVITALDADGANEYIDYVIDDLDRVQEMFDEIVSSWREGDLETLKTEQLDYIKQSPNQYKILIKDRNKKWLSKIDSYFRDKKSLFVLVGLLHLAGEDGLLEELDRLGYSIEQL